VKCFFVSNWHLYKITSLKLIKSSFSTNWQHTEFLPLDTFLLCHSLISNSFSIFIHLLQKKLASRDEMFCGSLLEWQFPLQNVSTSRKREHMINEIWQRVEDGDEWRLIVNISIVFSNHLACLNKLIHAFWKSFISHFNIKLCAQA